MNTIPEPLGDMSAVPMAGASIENRPVPIDPVRMSLGERIVNSKGLYDGIDASKPGLIPESFGKVDIVCGYVGDPGLGSPDTPHIWTLDEWNGIIDAVPGIRSLPIYVHSYPGDPETDAQNAVDAVEALGWRKNVGRFIAFDLETLVDPSYVSEVIRFTYAKGFRMIPYGSAYYVAKNPAPWGRWGALLTPKPPTTFPTGFRGIQWRFNDQGWDRSVFSEDIYANCGRGLRREV